MKTDHNIYAGTIPAVQSKSGARGSKTYHSVYQMSLTTKKRLTMPSQKERVDTFIDLIQTPEGQNWLRKTGKYRGQIDEYNAKKVGLEHYEKFNKYAGNQSVKFNDLYFNSLKSKGYTALIDDNDAGVWSRKPTILLSPKQTVKVTSVQQLTADDINRAQRAVMKNQRLNDSYARRSK